MNSKQRVGSHWCWAAGKSCAGGCAGGAAAGTQGAAQPCLCSAGTLPFAEDAGRGVQRHQGGDISLTAGSGQQSEAMVLEMVGDLLDSAGVCVQGVDVCSRNR